MKHVTMTALLEDFERLERRARELEAERDQARAEAAALREALDSIEWSRECGGGAFGEKSWDECPICDNERGAGHTTECPIGKALSTTAGAALLEKVKKLEQAVAASWGYCVSRFEGASDEAIEDKANEMVAALGAALDGDPNA